MSRRGAKEEPKAMQLPKEGSLKRAVMDLMLKNVADQKIMELMQPMAKKETVRTTISIIRRQGLVVPAPAMEPATDKFSFRVVGTGLLMFAEHAAKRGITTTEVACRLLRTIAEDSSLVDAVLDDAED